MSMCTPDSLRAWGRDYDGSPLPPEAAPMPGLTVGHLYDAADEIERLAEECQRAFDLGFRAAGGQIHPIIPGLSAGEYDINKSTDILEAEKPFSQARHDMDETNHARAVVAEGGDAERKLASTERPEGTNNHPPESMK